jgi:RimJ/RimL family protein N-acetyltransferase
MLLRDGNLLIRYATAQDAETLCTWWNDGRVMAHAGFPLGLNTTPQAIAKDLASDQDDIHRRLILEADSLPIGEMNYRNKGNHIAEIGIKICDFTKQEKGYGTRYLALLIGYLVRELGYHKIILDTNVNNLRAQHVYEKIGFRRVGTRVGAFTDQLGVAQSLIDYKLEADDLH